MSERLIVLVPAPTDDLNQPYWGNFVARVRMALDADGLDYRITTAEMPQHRIGQRGSNDRKENG